MPIVATIEPEALVLTFKDAGDFAELERILADSAPKARGKPLLLTLSKAESINAVACIAIAGRFMPPLKARVALVVRDARLYATAKEAKTVAEERRIECQVFGAWQVLSARLWLGTETPKAETILFVEDDPLMRGLAMEILLSHGYRVLEARTGAEALEVAVLDRGRVDLLLTDIMMPVMNGRELAFQFQKLYPECKVLFISGYDTPTLVKGGVVPAGAFVLQKPFTALELERSVAEVIGHS